MQERALAEEARVVGLVGLGTMGSRMAATLLRSGLSVVGWDLYAPAAAAAGAAGVEIADDPAGVAARAAVVITSLPDIHAVREAVLGPRGLAAARRPGLLVVDTSTATAADARALDRELAERGIGFLDAPVTGGPGGAEAGTLGVMVGGRPEYLRRARPVLDAIGSTVVHCGPVGAGQVTKAANQLIVVAALGAVAEALVLLRAAGVDPAAARQVLLAGYARSPILENQGARMLRRDWVPGGKAAYNLKDVAALAELTSETGVHTPVFDSAARYIQALVDAGGGDLDHSAIVTVVERMAGLPEDAA